MNAYGCAVAYVYGITPLSRCLSASSLSCDMMGLDDENGAGFCWSVCIGVYLSADSCTRPVNICDHLNVRDWLCGDRV